MADDIEAMVKREVAAARQILRDDKILARLPAPAASPVDDGKPKPPPKKDEPETPEVPDKKPGLWWGDAV